MTLLTPAYAARLALVIGNKDYAVGPLKNPLNDAEAVAAALGGPGGLGFQVTLVRNLKRDDIGRTVEGFANRIRPGDDVLVFYAGHGLQVKGVNYLPAVDARISVESDVALNSLNLNELLQRLDEAKAGVRLLLVDACRDNPYSRGFRSTARGLARVEGAPSGTLMHFATRPGGVASDGTGSNGVYTAELLKHLKTPNLPVESLLKRVASGVRQATNGSQQPWTEGALDGEFYFAGEGSPPELPGSHSVSLASRTPFGLAVSDLSEAQRHQIKLTKGGARVDYVEGLALRSGIRIGDVVIIFDNTEVTDARQLLEIARRADPSKPVTLLVRRDEWTNFIVVRP